MDSTRNEFPKPESLPALMYALRYTHTKCRLSEYKHGSTDYRCEFCKMFDEEIAKGEVNHG